MKKVLALFLVLGLASVSSAALVLSPGAVADSGASTIVMSTDSEIGAVAGGEGYLALVCDGGVGAITALAELFNPGMGDVQAYDGVVGTFGVTGLPAGSEGAWCAVFGLNGAIPAGSDLLSFTFDAVGPGVIELYELNNIGTEVAAGPIATVDVIPEPMTMSLLALGGLGLLRRRRA